MKPLLNDIDPVKPAKPKAKKRTKPKTKKKAKRPAKPKAKKIKAKMRKAVKSKSKKKAAARKLNGDARSERLDMRLTKAQKAKIDAKSKKTRRTVTSLVIEAIEKIR